MIFMMFLLISFAFLVRFDLSLRARIYESGRLLRVPQVLLVFANKQDLPNAMNASDLTVALPQSRTNKRFALLTGVLGCVPHARRTRDRPMHVRQCEGWFILPTSIHTTQAVTACHGTLRSHHSHTPHSKPLSSPGQAGVGFFATAHVVYTGHLRHIRSAYLSPCFPITLFIGRQSATVYSASWPYSVPVQSSLFPR